MRAFITSCSDAIAKTGSTADPNTDCEQDIAVIESYIQEKVVIRTSWIASYFNLQEYRDHTRLIWNAFGLSSTLLDISKKNYLVYELSETITNFMSSRLFQSYEWLSRLSGADLEFETYAPTGKPTESRSRHLDSDWFSKVEVKINNEVTYATY